jgi:uncharacterized lipoprotein YajG
MRYLPSLAVAFTLCACSNTVASLHYTPHATAAVAAAPSISAVTAIDQRKEAPTRLATIMGGYGNPLKTLDTVKPVKDEIVDAFTEGLQVRGLLALNGQAPFQIVLTVRKFDADMIIGRTARIDLTMAVLDQAGHVVYQDNATDSQSDMKFFETGILANIGDMQVLAQTALDRTVDRMLDNPAFRTAVARPAA